MASFYAESNRLATVFGDDAPRVNRELELTIPLNPQVSFGDIDDLLGDDDVDGAALWLDRDCVISNVWQYSDHRHLRYEISFTLTSHEYWNTIYLFQVPGTTEPGAPLPALEYFIDRITSYERWDRFQISSKLEADDDETRGLDVSPACFSNILRTSRLHNDGNRNNSVTMGYLSLTVEQTALLFTHDKGPICISLPGCRFHGPTLLQLGLATLQREQTNLIGGEGSNLHMTFGNDEISSTSLGELTALLSNRHLRNFCLLSYSNVSYDNVKKLVSALAANKISRLESLSIGFTNSQISKIEWEREEEPSAWINLWNAIQHHPSLKEIQLAEPQKLCQHSWWKPIIAAVNENPRLVDVGMRNAGYSNIHTWKTQLDEQVEPLLERNRYRPKIAALCRTDPSTAAVLLGQAIVAVACNIRFQNEKCRREILCMLLDQLVLTGHDFGVGRVLGKKRPLAETTVVVPK